MTTEAFCLVSNTFSLDVTAASQALAPTITPAPAAGSTIHVCIGRGIVT